MEIKERVQKMIEKGYTVYQMCSELNVYPEDIYNVINRLHIQGLYYVTKPTYNANAIFSLKSDNGDKDTNIDIEDGRFSFVAMSDVHDGSLYDDVERLDLLNDYIEENDINMLVCMGDIVDGPEHKNQSLPRRLNRLEDQINEIVQYYPYTGGTNVVALGDHDLDYKCEDGSTVNKQLRERRTDLKIYSSGSGIIKLNYQPILICHDANDSRVKQRITDDMIVLSGHSHLFYNNSYYTPQGPVLKFVTPSISNLPRYNNNAPGFLQLDFDFQQNYLNNVKVHHYIFMEDNSMLKASETNYNLNVGNSRSRKKK